MSGVDVRERIRIDRHITEHDRRVALHDATFWGLRETPKSISPVWLYDETGSVLFEEITRLPEYYLTRAEREILTARATEIAALTEPATLVELGAGSAEKTRVLLDALVETGALAEIAVLDVSEDFLISSAARIASDYPTLGIHAVVGDFERHLGTLPRRGRLLIAFLGSTIGNLEPESRRAFLASVSDALEPGDAFLVGIDLVKEPSRIAAAYADAAGITERFIRNALEVLNRELRADFRQDRFSFFSEWDPEREWVDLGLRARTPHTVSLRELDVEIAFDAGELLRVEVSSKFRLDRFAAELAAAGLVHERAWTDGRRDFALVLARAGGTLSTMP